MSEKQRDFLKKIGIDPDTIPPGTSMPSPERGHSSYRHVVRDGVVVLERIIYPAPDER